MIYWNVGMLEYWIIGHAKCVVKLMDLFPIEFYPDLSGKVEHPDYSIGSGVRGIFCPCPSVLGRVRPC